MATSGPAADRTIAATAMLLALSLGAAVGMGRLFRGGDWIVPVLGAAVAAHAVAWLGRRLNLAPPAAVAISTVGVVLYAVWAVLPHSTAYGIPWTGTLHAAGTALSQARTAFSNTTPPTRPIPGYLLTTDLALGTIAVLADWAAFRIKATLEACVPAFALFVFAATLDQAHRHRATYTAVFLVPLMAFVLVHQADLRASGSAWFASRARGGSAALLEGGALIGAAAVAVALLVGPILPTARQRGIYDPHRSGATGAGSNRAVVSPLVNIRDGLVQQSAIEFFTVKSTAPAYWRLTALDTFDGVIWSANESYRSIHQKLPDVQASAAGADEVDQNFAITALSSVWLPAAYEPQEITGAHQVSFNPDSGSLITAATSSDDQRYRVRSLVAAAHLTPAELNQVTDVSNVDPKYTQLPLNIDPRIRQLARVITARATTPFEKALAIQDYFHGNGFTYDLNVPGGHDNGALANFLFNTRRGFCEQYAGAYGVLARLAGLPTRLAVGFTPGELQSDGLYHVKGLNYHAWPEVYLDQYGWVAFEPTPGRGQPGAQGYTGLQPAQASESSAGVTITVPTTVATPTSTPAASPTTLPRDLGGGGLTSKPRRHTHYELIILGILVGSLLLALLGAVTVALLLVHRRRLRRRAAAAKDDAARILLAWDDSVELLGLAGAPRRPSETISEYAQRAPASSGLNAEGRAALRWLARAASVAAYAPPGRDVSVATADQLHAEAEQAEGAAQSIEAALRQDASGTDRLLWDIDYRRLRRPIEPEPASPSSL